MTSNGHGNRWYAVQCQPHRERLASVNLERQTFEVFLPLRHKTRRHARRTETLRVPFFPGYLFVALDLERHQWRAVNGTLGVVRLVALGERPTPAPEGLVEALRTACAENVLEWHPQLALGEPVRILAGPFAGLVGELERMTDADRVRVLLRMMGGDFPVSLSRLDVMPAISAV